MNVKLSSQAVYAWKYWVIPAPKFSTYNSQALTLSVNKNSMLSWIVTVYTHWHALAHTGWYQNIPTHSKTQPQSITHLKRLNATLPTLIQCYRSKHIPKHHEKSRVRSPKPYTPDITVHQPDLNTPPTSLCFTISDTKKLNMPQNTAPTALQFHRPKRTSTHSYTSWDTPLHPPSSQLIRRYKQAVSEKNKIDRE